MADELVNCPKPAQSVQVLALTANHRLIMASTTIAVNSLRNSDALYKRLARTVLLLGPPFHTISSGPKLVCGTLAEPFAHACQAVAAAASGDNVLMM